MGLRENRKLMLLLFNLISLKLLMDHAYVAIGLYLIRMRMTQQRNPIRYTMSKRIPRQISYLRDLINDHRQSTKDNLRLSMDVFNKLCIILEVRAGLRAGRYVSIHEMVDSFLGVLGHGHKMRVQKHRFYRSTESIHRHFHKVLRCVLRLHDVMFVKPHEITDNSAFNFFQGCHGTLDGTHIKVTGKTQDHPRYRTRKNEIATNVLGVCDERMLFIYTLAGWEGSASDSRVVRDALLRHSGFRVHRGHYYLADCGYTLSEGFLTPYRGVRYHLKSWGPNELQQQNSQEYFNMRHAQARNVIERAWGLMKKRWSILRTASFYDIRTQVKIITACAILHNFIRMESDVDPWEAQVNPIDENEYGDWVTAVEHTTAAATWRDDIATAMYAQWQNGQ